MKAGWLWEASLVVKTVKGFDACLRPSAALSRGYDGVADAAIRQPARTATVQTFTPRKVQLCCCSKLCSCSSAVWLRFIKRQLLWNGVMKHLPCKKTNKQKTKQNQKHVLLSFLPNVWYLMFSTPFAASHIVLWLYVDYYPVLAYHRCICVSGLLEVIWSTIMSTDH